MSSVSHVSRFVGGGTRRAIQTVAAPVLLPRHHAAVGGDSILGFWPYGQPGAAASRDPAAKNLWLHAFVFSGWILFAILQSALVRRRKVNVHRVLGWAGTGLAAAMVIVGTMTAIQLGHFDVTVLHVPGGDTFEIVSFADMFAFPLLVAIAVVYRRDLELHRRLLMLATVELTGAGFGRIDFLFNHNLMFSCADAVMCLGVLRDLYLDGRVHRAYKITIPVLVCMHIFITWMYLRPPLWWSHLAHTLMG